MGSSNRRKMCRSAGENEKRDDDGQFNNINTDLGHSYSSGREPAVCDTIAPCSRENGSIARK
jgi:hypothetical protein